MFPGDLTIDVLGAAMRGSLARNRAIVHNLANADTPGYRRLDVQFESALARAAEDERVRRTPGAKLSGVSFSTEPLGEFQPTIQQFAATQIRLDGSNVDADAESAQLSANQLSYQTIVGLLDKHLGQIRTAITG